MIDNTHLSADETEQLAIKYLADLPQQSSDSENRYD